MRSLRFAGWVIAVLATQAQIGRTGSGNQPAALQQWYRLLKLFEVNPDAARPAECMQSSSTFGIVAMSVGLAGASLFMLLALPLVSSPLVWLGAKLIYACSSEKQRAAHSAKAVASVARRVSSVVRRNSLSPEMIDGDACGVELVSRRSEMREHSQVLLVGNPMQQHQALTAPGGAEAGGEAEGAAEAEGEAEGGGAVGGGASSRGCCGRPRSTKDGEKAVKTKKVTRTPLQMSSMLLGGLRKGCAGTTLLIHPLVVNFAFQSVHCVIDPAGGAGLVVARSPATQCFGPAHLPVWLLAVATIGVEVVIFPLYIIAAVGASLGWFHSRCCGAPPPPPLLSTTLRDESSGKEEEAVASAPLHGVVVSKAGEIELGQVHGGLCCRCGCCVRVLRRARAGYDAAHDKDGAAPYENDALRIAFSSFTKTDYKPEYFFFRLFFRALSGHSRSLSLALALFKTLSLTLS